MDWDQLPVATLKVKFNASESDQQLYPGEHLDAIVNQLRASVGNDWRLVALTDDVHHLRVEDNHPPSEQRDRMQRWLKRRETHIYAAADSVLTVTVQDRQTITSLLSGGAAKLRQTRTHFSYGRT